MFDGPVSEGRTADQVVVAARTIVGPRHCTGQLRDVLRPAVRVLERNCAADFATRSAAGQARHENAARSRLPVRQFREPGHTEWKYSGYKYSGY